MWLLCGRVILTALDAVLGNGILLIEANDGLLADEEADASVDALAGWFWAIRLTSPGLVDLRAVDFKNIFFFCVFPVSFYLSKIEKKHTHTKAQQIKSELISHYCCLTYCLICLYIYSASESKEGDEEKKSKVY